MALGTVAAAITARYLSPADKGLLATMTFLMGVTALICTAGLGDAAIVELNKRRTPATVVVPSTVGFAALLGMGGALGLAAAFSFLFRSSWTHSRSAALLVSTVVPLSAVNAVLSQLFAARERIVATSLVTSAMAVAATGSLVVLALLGALTLLSATFATISAAWVGIVIYTLSLGSDRRCLVSRPRATYIRRVLRYGLFVQASYVVVSLHGRFDIVIVQQIAGNAEAGYYSVALTIGTLTAYAGLAIGYAAFPRLAGLSADAAVALTIRLFRLAILTGVSLALLLSVATPFIVRVLFGEQYAAAIGPARILLPGGVVYCAQTLLARSRASQGDAGLLVRSFGTSLLVMCLLDVALIPTFGVVGAACASTASSVVGLGIAVRGWSGPRIVPARELVPRISDGRAILDVVRRVLPRTDIP